MGLGFRRKVAQGYVCPDCGNFFQPHAAKPTGHWRCRFCHGEMVAFQMVAKLGGAAFLERLKHRPGVELNGKRRRCAYCHQAMKLIEVGVGSDPLHLDLCLACESVWFDSGEIVRALYRRTKVLPKPVVRDDLLSTNLQVSDGRDPDILIEAIFDIVNIEDDSPVTTVPYATFSILLLLLLVNTLATHTPSLRDEWGFLTSAPFRHGGLTWLTSVFLHDGGAHLAGNLFFLFMFGGMLELANGSFLLLEVFAVSAIGANLLYLLTAPAQAVLVVGCSGSVLGVIAYYCLCFPRSRVTIPALFFSWTQRRFMDWPVFYVTRWQIPAQLLLVFYIGLNFIGFYLQRYLPWWTGNTSFIGHLGAMGGAALVYFLTRK